MSHPPTPRSEAPSPATPWPGQGPAPTHLRTRQTPTPAQPRTSERPAPAPRTSERPAPPTPRRPTRTLWEQGRRPGGQVVVLSLLGSVAFARLDLLTGAELSLLFDVAFVVICVTAALSVRPRDFFAVGVLPPLLMFGTVTLLALVARSAVADEVDNVVQAVVSGLAHHAGALVTGYAATFAVLALRQVAVRNSGRLRSFG